MPKVVIKVIYKTKCKVQKYASYYLGVIGILCKHRNIYQTFDSEKNRCFDITDIIILIPFSSNFDPFTFLVLDIIFKNLLVSYSYQGSHQFLSVTIWILCTNKIPLNSADENLERVRRNKRVIERGWKRHLDSHNPSTSLIGIYCEIEIEYSD
jgi:hypothetical protein